jgi:hypothetical protein
MSEKDVDVLLKRPVKDIGTSRDGEPEGTRAASLVLAAAIRVTRAVIAIIRVGGFAN